MTPADARLFRQYGPRLARPGSFLAKDTAGDFGLYVARNKAQKPLAQIEASVVRKWLHSDLLEVDSTADTGHYMISSAGRAFLRRAAQAGARDRSPGHACHCRCWPTPERSAVELGCEPGAANCGRCLR